MHCSCDERFYDCLHNSEELASTKVGLIYFSVLNTKCFRKDHPIVGCKRHSLWVVSVLVTSRESVLDFQIRVRERVPLEIFTDSPSLAILFNLLFYVCHILCRLKIYKQRVIATCSRNDIGFRGEGNERRENTRLESHFRNFLWESRVNDLLAELLGVVWSTSWTIANRRYTSGSTCPPTKSAAGCQRGVFDRSALCRRMTDRDPSRAGSRSTPNSLEGITRHIRAHNRRAKFPISTVLLSAYLNKTAFANFIFPTVSSFVFHSPRLAVAQINRWERRACVHLRVYMCARQKIWNDYLTKNYEICRPRVVKRINQTLSLSESVLFIIQYVDIGKHGIAPRTEICRPATKRQQLRVARSVLLIKFIFAACVY